MMLSPPGLPLRAFENSDGEPQGAPNLGLVSFFAADQRASMFAFGALTLLRGEAMPSFSSKTFVAKLAVG